MDARCRLKRRNGFGVRQTHEIGHVDHVQEDERRDEEDNRR